MGPIVAATGVAATVVAAMGVAALTVSLASCALYFEDSADDSVRDPDLPEPQPVPFPLPPDAAPPPPPPCKVALDPSNAQENIALSDDNLVAMTEADSSQDTVFATDGRREGRYYFEVYIEELGQRDRFTAVGIGTGVGGNALEIAPGIVGSGCSVQSGVSYCMGQGNENTALYMQPGSVVGVALDAGVEQVFFHIDGNWLEGRDPYRGDEGMWLGPLPENSLWLPALTVSRGDRLRANFAGPFAFFPPLDYEPYGGSAQCDEEPEVQCRGAFDPRISHPGLEFAQDLSIVSGNDRIVSGTAYADVAHYGGAWYFEIAVIFHQSPHMGVGIGLGFELEAPPGNLGPGCSLYPGYVSCDSRRVFVEAPDWSMGDLIGVAVDFDKSEIFFNHNGDWIDGREPGYWDPNTGEPVEQTAGFTLADNGFRDTYFAGVTVGAGDLALANFTGPFNNLVPPGFAAYAGFCQP